MSQPLYPPPGRQRARGEQPGSSGMESPGSPDDPTPTVRRPAAGRAARPDPAVRPASMAGRAAAGPAAVRRGGRRSGQPTYGPAAVRAAAGSAALAEQPRTASPASLDASSSRVSRSGAAVRPARTAVGHPGGPGGCRRRQQEHDDRVGGAVVVLAAVGAGLAPCSSATTTAPPPATTSARFCTSEEGPTVGASRPSEPSRAGASSSSSPSAERDVDRRRQLLRRRDARRLVTTRPSTSTPRRCYDGDMQACDDCTRRVEVGLALRDLRRHRRPAVQPIGDADVVFCTRRVLGDLRRLGTEDGALDLLAEVRRLPSPCRPSGSPAAA